MPLVAEPPGRIPGVTDVPGKHAPTARPQRVEARVRRHPEHPCAKACASVIAVETTPGVELCILQDVLRVVVRSHHAVAEEMKIAAGGFHKSTERVVVAAGRAGDQLRLSRCVFSHDRSVFAIVDV